MNHRIVLFGFRASLIQSGSRVGFTLVEVLVVMVILGILSAVAVPNYFNQVRRARYAQAASDMSAMQKAVLIYLAGEGEFPPDVNGGSVPANIVPFYADSWPTVGPYGAEYDYEEWIVGSTGCYIQFTFYGQNMVRDTMAIAPVVPEGGLEQFNDDLILSLGQQQTALCPSAP